MGVKWDPVKCDKFKYYVCGGLERYKNTQWVIIVPGVISRILLVLKEIFWTASFGKFVILSKLFSPKSMSNMIPILSWKFCGKFQLSKRFEMFDLWQSIKTGTVVVWLSHLQIEQTESSLRLNDKDIENKNTKIVFFIFIFFFLISS